MLPKRLTVLIVGPDRAEFCRPKPKEVDVKHFFACRNQLYRLYPGQIQRCKYSVRGHNMGTFEMVVYPENGIRCTNARGEYVTVDKLLADIDEQKHAWSRFHKPYGQMSSKMLSSLWRAAPFILMGAILAYAFISNGGTGGSLY